MMLLARLLWSLGLRGAAFAVALQPYSNATPVQAIVLGTMIQVASAAHGVPVGVAVSVAFEESRFDLRARSSAGALGVMQVIPGHRCRWCSPAVNAIGERWLFVQSVNVYEGVWRLAEWHRQKGRAYLCHYNTGWTCKPAGRRYQRRVERRAMGLLRRVVGET
jgi:hypothetical protein